MITTGQEYSGLVRNDQDCSVMIRTGEKWSGHNQDWSDMIMTGKEGLGLVRNDQNLSGMIRTDRVWSGRIKTDQK